MSNMYNETDGFFFKFHPVVDNWIYIHVENPEPSRSSCLLGHCLKEMIHESLSEKLRTQGTIRCYGVEPEMHVPLLGPFPLLRVNAATDATTTNPSRTSMTPSAHHCAGINRLEGKGMQLWLCCSSENLQDAEAGGRRSMCVCECPGRLKPCPYL